VTLGAVRRRLGWCRCGADPEYRGISLRSVRRVRRGGCVHMTTATPYTAQRARWPIDPWSGVRCSCGKALLLSGWECFDALAVTNYVLVGSALCTLMLSQSRTMCFMIKTCFMIKRLFQIWSPLCSSCRSYESAWWREGSHVYP
jgi:hypothetical protein